MLSLLINDVSNWFTTRQWIRYLLIQTYYVYTSVLKIEGVYLLRLKLPFLTPIALNAVSELVSKYSNWLLGCSRINRNFLSVRLSKTHEYVRDTIIFNRQYLNQFFFYYLFITFSIVPNYVIFNHSHTRMRFPDYVHKLDEKSITRDLKKSSIFIFVRCS